MFHKKAEGHASFYATHRSTKQIQLVRGFVASNEISSIHHVREYVKQTLVVGGLFPVSSLLQA